MDTRDFRIREETYGWHRFITYETGVMPTGVYFEGSRGGGRKTAALVIKAYASSLGPEPMRYPPAKDENDKRTPEERAHELSPK